MQEYIEFLERREALLERCIRKTEQMLASESQGHLQTAQKGNRCSYYQVMNRNGCQRKYIPARNISLAKALASRDYAAKLLRKLQAEKQALARYIKTLQRCQPEEVFTHMSHARQKLVSPLLVSDEMCAQMWENESYKQSTHKPEAKIYPTKKGDMVRSKSEVLFADMYYDMGIPYRYEEVLTLPNGETVAPDFTLWDKKRRRVMYHEHFGLIDDPTYRKSNLKKIDDYRRAGIYSSKNFITTFEGDGAVLNMKEIRTMIEDLMA